MSSATSSTPEKPILPPIGPVDGKMTTLDETKVNKARLEEWMSGVDGLRGDGELKETLSQLHSSILRSLHVFQKVERCSNPKFLTELNNLTVEYSTLARVCEIIEKSPSGQ